MPPFSVNPVALLLLFVYLWLGLHTLISPTELDTRPHHELAYMNLLHNSEGVY